MTVLERDEFVGDAYSRHRAGRFSFGHWFASGKEVRAHQHEDAHFMFIVTGSYVSRVPGNSNLIYNPPETVHADRFETGGSFFALSVPLVDGATLPPSSSRITSVACHALIARLMRECASWQSDSTLIAESLCFELLGDRSREASPPRWLARARELLHERAPSSLTEVARAAGVHPIHLTRTFRRFYRCTPGEYVRSIRAARGARILATTKTPLSEVALEAGFADQSHFTKAFRRAYGASPGEYRRAVS